MTGRKLILLMATVLVWSCNRSQVSSGTGDSDGGQASESPVIRFCPTEPGVIEVANLDASVLTRVQNARLTTAAYASFFAVYPTSIAIPDAPPMLGGYAIENSVLRFTPRFPLIAGQKYKIRFDENALRRIADDSTRTEPAASSEPHFIERALAFSDDGGGGGTTVATIYPTGDRLLVNQLKLYLCFTAPMSVGEAYERVHLFDEKGRPVARPFLQVDQELWDPDRRRFTLLFDPGRVKRGLRSNLEDGAPLVEGRRYRLSIDQEWIDGRGRPLERAAEKWFFVTAADRKTPSHSRWRIEPPSTDSSDPLSLRFDEALDQASLEEMITVLDSNENRIPGRIEILDGETQWRFHAEKPWRSGEYSLLIDRRLEDRAGNNLDRVFDMDLKIQRPAHIRRPPTKLSFFVNLSQGAGRP